MDNEKVYKSVEDALFKSNVHYDKLKNVWVMTVKNSQGKEIRHVFDRKPVWIKSIEECNKILLRSKNPIQLRIEHDLIWDIAVKSDDAVRRTFKREYLDEYLNIISDKNTLKLLGSIYKIKLDDEEKSCDAGGSMPSAQCSTIRRLLNVVEAINYRLQMLDKVTLYQKKSPDISLTLTL